MSLRLPNIRTSIPPRRSSTSQLSSPAFIVGRVLTIDLNNEISPGIIQFESLYTKVKITTTAIPKLANYKHYPVPNELVYITIGPSVDLNTSPSATTYYYEPPYNMWSSNTTNEMPNLGTQPDQRLSLKDDPVYRLKQFTGDITLESRYGSSIRFGSTSPTSSLNAWSRTGEQGDPITIITNGHKKVAAEPWNSITEDIDVDQASIWMSSTQALHVKDFKNFSLESFLSRRKTSEAATLQTDNQDTSTSLDTVSPADQDSPPQVSDTVRFVGNQEVTVLSKRIEGAKRNQIRYALGAQYTYFRKILSGVLRAKDTQAYDLFRQGFGQANRSGQVQAYIDNSTYNYFLTPTEVRNALGADYDAFIQVVQNLIQIEPGLRQSLFGTVEGDIQVRLQNYGRRWDTLIVTTVFAQSGTEQYPYYQEYWQYDRVNNQFKLQIVVEEGREATQGGKYVLVDRKRNKYLEYLDVVSLETLRWEPDVPVTNSA